MTFTLARPHETDSIRYDSFVRCAWLPQVSSSLVSGAVSADRTAVLETQRLSVLNHDHNGSRPVSEVQTLAEEPRFTRERMPGRRLT